MMIILSKRASTKRITMQNYNICEKIPRDYKFFSINKIHLKNKTKKIEKKPLKP